MSALYVPIRRFVYLTIGVINRLIPSDGPRIFVLCYHSISNDGWDFSVRPEEFKKQINYLSENYKFISLNDLSLYLRGIRKIDKPSVVVTFDDGYKNIFQVKSFLQSKGVKPAIFILSDRKNASRDELGTHTDFLSKNEIKKLVSEGWEVGCHTATHPAIEKLNLREIKKEIVDSKLQLESELGLPVKYFAFPKGVYNSEVLKAVKKAGYALGLTMDDALIGKETDVLRIPRVGVDGTHSFAEFKVLFQPLALGFRKLVKETKPLSLYNCIRPLLFLRGFLNRIFNPSAKYFLATRSLEPLSSKFGFDRGVPIDRFWIEAFLEENHDFIHGRCLEVADASYINKFGGSRVSCSDVLDIDPNNKLANIHGDLRNLKSQIKPNTYDCIILTHVLGLIDDYLAALSECRRILKPGGALIFTGSCLGPILGREKVYWRFTPYSIRFVLEKLFRADRIKIKVYGNVLAGQCFWVGMAQQELNEEELKFYDFRYPCVVGAVAFK